MCTNRWQLALRFIASPAGRRKTKRVDRLVYVYGWLAVGWERARIGVSPAVVEAGLMVLDRLDSKLYCQAAVGDDGKLGCFLYIVTRRIIKLDSIFMIVDIQNLEKSTYLPPFTIPSFTHTKI